MERAVPSAKCKTMASAACIPRRASTAPYSMAATVFPTAWRIVSSLSSGLGGPIILGYSPLLACWLSIRAPSASCGRPLPSDTPHLTLAWSRLARPGAVKPRVAKPRYKLPVAAQSDCRRLVRHPKEAAPPWKCPLARFAPQTPSISSNSWCQKNSWPPSSKSLLAAVVQEHVESHVVGRSQPPQDRALPAPQVGPQERVAHPHPHADQRFSRRHTNLMP